MVELMQDFYNKKECTIHSLKILIHGCILCFFADQIAWPLFYYKNDCTLNSLRNVWKKRCEFVFFLFREYEFNYIFYLIEMFYFYSTIELKILKRVLYHLSTAGNIIFLVFTSTIEIFWIWSLFHDPLFIIFVTYFRPLLFTL